jgi:transposase
MMLFLPRAVKVFVSSQPSNLRKSFDGLSIEVRAVLGHDPVSGHVFVFLNRRKTQVRLLWWTRGGFAILAKRLEKGVFRFPEQVQAGAKCVQIEEHELALLFEGVDPSQIRFSPRWEPGQPGAPKESQKPAAT